MEPNEKEQNPAQNAEAAAKEPAKNKTLASDKRLFIVIAILIVLAFVAMNMVPRIASELLMKGMENKVSVTDPFNALINGIGGPQALNDKNAEDLINGITRTANDIKHNEQTFLSHLPEEIRNKQFANAAERAAFYNALLESYNSGTKNTQQSKKFLEEFGAVQFLAFLYNSDNYIGRIKEMQAKSDKPATEEK